MGSTTVIFPLELGSASNFEESDFPLAYHDNVSSIVVKGSLLLSATLDEVIKIKELGVDLHSNPQFLLNTRLKYEDLAKKQARLEKYRKTLNPIKYLVNYRAARIFYAAALSLWTQTRETSERMKRRDREVRAVPSTEIRAVNDVRSDAKISGIAITLPGPLGSEEEKTINDLADEIVKHATDPFISNPSIPQLGDAESLVTLPDTASLLSLDVSGSDPQEAEPTSPGSPSYHFHFYKSMVTTGSNIQDLTLNQGLGNRGC